MTQGGDLVHRLRLAVADIGAHPGRDGRLPPERELAEHLAVGRSQLRRALAKLEADGEIFRRQGQGTFAAPPPAVGSEGLRVLATAISPAEVMEVRRGIEPRLAALAASRSGDGDIAALRQLVMRGAGAADPAAYEIADEIFHHRLAELARNALFLRVYQEIRAVRRMTRWHAERAADLTRQQIRDRSDEHARIVDAIAAHDAAGAADAMDRHLGHVATAMQQARKG